MWPCVARSATARHGKMAKLAFGAATSLALAFAATNASAASGQAGAAIVRAWYLAKFERFDSGAAGALQSANFRDHRGASAEEGASPVRRELLQVIAQDDHVAVFSHSGRPGADEVGYMDLFRIAPDGKIAEHWGLSERQPPPSALLHTNGWITKPNPIDTDAAGKEAANTRVVMSFFNDILAKGDMSKSSDVQADQYIQHATGVKTGNAGLREWAAQTNMAANPWHVQVFKVVAHGNYVFMYGRGSGLGSPVLLALTDWFRVENGKLQEHWGFVRPITESAAASELDRFENLEPLNGPCPLC